MPKPESAEQQKKDHEQIKTLDKEPPKKEEPWEDGLLFIKYLQLVAKTEQRIYVEGLVQLILGDTPNTFTSRWQEACKKCPKLTQIPPQLYKLEEAFGGEILKNVKNKKKNDLIKIFREHFFEPFELIKKEADAGLKQLGYNNNELIRVQSENNILKTENKYLKVTCIAAYVNLERGTNQSDSKADAEVFANIPICCLKSDTQGNINFMDSIFGKFSGDIELNQLNGMKLMQALNEVLRQENALLRVLYKKLGATQMSFAWNFIFESFETFKSLYEESPANKVVSTTNASASPAGMVANAAASGLLLHSATSVTKPSGTASEASLTVKK